MEDVERLTSDLAILVSERGSCFGELIASLTRNLTRSSTRIGLIVPQTIRENDLLTTAGRQRFEFAVLFLNNIAYSSGDRGCVANDSVALVQKMVESFRRPIIGVYGWPDSPDYPSRILNAGATAVFRMPFDTEAMQMAVKTCLNPWHLDPRI
jgi:hypothetical protein